MKIYIVLEQYSYQYHELSLFTKKSDALAEIKRKRKENPDFIKVKNILSWKAPLSYLYLLEKEL